MLKNEMIIYKINHDHDYCISACSPKWPFIHSTVSAGTDVGRDDEDEDNDSGQDDDGVCN